MFRIKYKQRNIQKRIVIALALLCLVVCAVNVQLYLERQISTHIVTCTNKLNQQGDFFDMSLNELMEVVVVSKSEERPSSFLLNFHCYHPDWAQQLT
jgi:hypothetical protein